MDPLEAGYLALRTILRLSTDSLHKRHHHESGGEGVCTRRVNDQQTRSSRRILKSGARPKTSPRAPAPQASSSPPLKQLKCRYLTKRATPTSSQRAPPTDPTLLLQPPASQAPPLHGPTPAPVRAPPHEVVGEDGDQRHSPAKQARSPPILSTLRRSGRHREPPN